jgi:DNA-binding winged helix-turn-helix (wHTH) protein/tetratricopeptide (TPR) repeat protein
MPHQPQQSARVTFGPFEVDASTGELFKSGVRIRLTGQPFRILILLLDHAGEILTREKLREQIWGEGTFVDFEHSLNVAINKLRRTLNDSAETPRYIETLSGRGYRFIGSIEETVKPNGMAAGPAAKPVITDDASTSAAALPVKAYPMATHRWGIGAALLAFVAIAGAAWFHFRPVPMFTEKDTIVLADFRNSTGDPVFEGTLRHGLAVELQESPFISLISDARVHEVLDLMLQPADARLTPELAREVCERTGSAAVLDGSIARMGSRYVLGLQAKNCRTGDVLDDQQVQAANKEDVLGAVARMAARFRKRAGESLATIKQHSTPLSEATTPSLDAWKAFTTGWNVLTSKGHAAALPWFERATRIDPEFAAAYAWRGRMYSAVGQGALAAESTRKAWQLRNRASDHERFYIDFSYHRFVTGNLEQALRVCELWVQAYPRDTLPHGFLASSAATAIGKFDKAAAEAEKAIELDPDNPMAYANLANAYRFRNQLEEAERTIQRGVDRKLASPDFQLARFYFAFLKNDLEGMERVARLSQDEPELQDLIADQRGFVFAYHGRLRQARTMSQWAVDLARQSDNLESAAQHEAAAAVREALFGSPADARKHAVATLAMSKARDAAYGAAVALALSKDDAHARSLADDLGQRYPEDTLIRFLYLPTLRAIIALNHHNFSEGIELLEVAAPYELGWEGCCSVGFTPSLYPVYVRGEVYLASGHGALAAAEFQKILDHRGIVATDPIGALAHLQLGRAYAQSGNTAKAKAAYEEFLTLWKDADQDNRILREAKAECLQMR